MENIFPEIFGWIGATLTSVSFVPQAVRIMYTRDTKALSLGMYLVFGAGVAFWLVYGVFLASWPIIAANVVTLTLVVIIIVLKLRHG